MLLCGVPNALAAEDGHVAGTVTDAATRAGVEGVEVCARLRSERSGGHCAITGQNGEYTIKEVPVGSYIVEFVVPSLRSPGSPLSDLDYAPQYYDDKTGSAEAEEVTVLDEDTTSGIDAAMLPGGRIAGVVTDAETHDPIAGIQACAYIPLGYSPSRCGETNANGEYAIGSLVSGEYVVVFTAPTNGPLDYARQYYDDQVSAEQANEVPVTVGETTSGIDAAMQAGGSITGQVTVVATGSPLMNASVCAFSVAVLSIGNETPERCAQTNANGEYTLSQLTAGQEIVEFRDEFGTGFVLQYYDGKSSRSEATQLSVAQGVTTTGVDAAMHAVGEVKEEKIEPPHETETTLSTDLVSATPLVKAAPLVTLATSTLVVSKDVARVPIACSQAACQGSIELVMQVAAHGRGGKATAGQADAGKTAAHVKTLVLATGSFSLADGHSGSVLLHLTLEGRRRLRRARQHRLVARLLLSVNGAGTVSRAVAVG